MIPTDLENPPLAGRKSSTCLDCIHLELARGVALEHVESKWCIVSAAGRVPFALPPGTTEHVLTEIMGGGIGLSQLAPLLANMDGPLSVERQITRLWNGGLLVQSIRHEGRMLAMLHSRGGTQLIPSEIDCDQDLIMNEDACVRYGNGELILESAACGDYIQVNAAWLRWLTLPVSGAMSCSEWANGINLPVPVMMALASLLMEIGVLKTCTASRRSAEQDQGWSFADRMMHARSRRGRHVGGYGGTFRFKGKLPETPALKETPGAIEIPLLQPQMDAIVRRDPTLTEAMEKRRSTRQHSGEPLKIERLSEFLYRTGRITKKIAEDNREFALRPYPSGGRSYELEIYPLVNHCSGIEPGLYRYNGLAHSLVHVASCGPLTQEIIADAQQSAIMRGKPQVLLLISARFMRVSWKYESLSYALTLKHVGVLYQTMYLVASAMGLAACALGGGPSDSLSRLIHSNFWEESGVGEFLLGEPELS